MLLVSQYREHEKFFRGVNCEKKSVWELTTAEFTDTRFSQECSFHREIAEFYGCRPNVRSYGTASSSSGKADFVSAPSDRVTRRKARGDGRRR